MRTSGSYGRAIARRRARRELSMAYCMVEKLEKEIVVKNLRLSENTREFIDGSTRSAEKLRTSYLDFGCNQTHEND